jgi:serine protease
MRIERLLAAVLLSLLPLACTDDPEVPLQPTSPSSSTAALADAGQIPPRTEDYGAQWLAMSDAEMWAYITQYDTLVNVGLKTPGAMRGIWRTEVLVSPPEQVEGRQAIEAIRGSEIVHEFTGLPAVQVRVADAEALGRLRKLPFADYVEPNVLQGGFLSSGSDSGCEYHAYSPSTGTTFAGDKLPPHYSRIGVQIDRAWNRARGDGVVMGLTDTGISDQQEHLLSRFDESHSAGRWYVYRGVGVLDWRESSCSHGTRMAGTMAAPMNGGNMVGVAWKANLVSAHQANRVYDVDAGYAAEAIRIAASERDNYYPNRRIVTMAWQSNGSSLISDQIRKWYGLGRLFVGAAGTIDYFGIAFPADMPEVVAVSAVDPDTYGEITGLNYGDQVELSFPVKQLSNGKYAPDLVSLGGSSGATAAVSGIAALVWSKYPNESNLDIRQRLRGAAHNYPNHNRVVGYGVPNATKAVGGMWYASIGCGNKTDCTFHYKLSQCETKTFSVSHQGGDGPYSYRWSTGSTSRSTSMTLCPDPEKIAYYSISVTVRDPDQFGTTSIYRYASIEVTSSNPDDACPTCPK